MHAQHRPAPVVTARGDIDLATAPSLRRRLADALATHPEVVVDMSQVTFMDCAGLSALVDARNRADAHGGRLLLRGTNDKVRRLLTLTGLHRRLTPEP
ncbi:STAS domain-containing protein [Peterkaempfera griseoplana]|uniref:STAS domain-containing protein n=1 Tax=Peterkaempfera griseoplana TaxID=66896 RepID=UPI0006E2A7C0|nr:STAS domain-containing protein [Peterkaempfera griseoplana]